jgi:hypothetical protein
MNSEALIDLRPVAVVDDRLDLPPDALPLDYMLAVMRDPSASEARRDRMAIAAAKFCHPQISFIADQSRFASADFAKQLDEACRRAGKVIDGRTLIRNEPEPKAEPATKLTLPPSVAAAPFSRPRRF